MTPNLDHPARPRTELAGVYGAAAARAVIEAALLDYRDAFGDPGDTGAAG
ncbi:MAG: hypothetical protein HZC42_13100 [Candidatus Eisenbacteria bacterium]|nr:hypothetical protein [Candidatus Eisenbacteria bacterium]